MKRKIIQYLRERLKPKLPEDVEGDLEKAIQILLNSGVPIKEIRLFGSLDKCKWNRERSDIDVYVLLDTNDERYSAFTDVIVRHRMVLDGDDCVMMPVYGETQERRNLRNLVEGNPDLLFSRKYELHIATPEDDKRMWEEGAPLTGPFFIFGKQNMRPYMRNCRKGRLLYPKNET